MPRRSSFVVSEELVRCGRLDPPMIQVSKTRGQERLELLVEDEFTTGAHAWQGILSPSMRGGAVLGRP